MKRQTILLLIFLSIILVTYGCAQKGGEVVETKKETTPPPSSPPSRQAQENLTVNLNDIESQMKELEELEKSLQVINNMSFQI